MSDQDNADRPATFREVLASGEYRALYLASALSWFGDYVARAAVTSLVYQRTGRKDLAAKELETFRQLNAASVADRK